MREFEHATFLIKQSVPSLAEAVDALIVERSEACLGMAEVAANGLERARRRAVRPGVDFLDQGLLPAVLEETHPAFGVNS